MFAIGTVKIPIELSQLLVRVSPRGAAALAIYCVKVEEIMSQFVTAAVLSPENVSASGQSIDALSFECRSLGAWRSMNHVPYMLRDLEDLCRLSGNIVLLAALFSIYLYSYIPVFAQKKIESSFIACYRTPPSKILAHIQLCYAL